MARDGAADSGGSAVMTRKQARVGRGVSLGSWWKGAPGTTARCAHRGFTSCVLAAVLGAAGLQAGCGAQEEEALAGASAAARAGSKFIAKERPIPESYLVVLEPAAEEAGLTARELARLYRGELRQTYQAALRGFSIRMPLVRALQLAADPRVRLVEEDAEVWADEVQAGATWGLDRIHQRWLPLDGSYGYQATGAGVTAYVIDTGVYVGHAELAGRAHPGFTAVLDGLGSDDCHGHGTHVAGTIGGTTYGVAKDVTLYAVRVLDCGGTGSTSAVVAGVDWVTAHHAGPSVANMSLGGPASDVMDAAIQGSIASGVVYVLAAGNSAWDACYGSPSRTPEALTVGASAPDDSAAWFSNGGPCVDLFAPGLEVTSSTIGGETATAVFSGTSMASPHVAGAVALLLEQRPGATAAEVHELTLGLSTAGALTGAKIPGTPNLLLYSGWLTRTAAPATPPRVAVTAPSAGATVGGTVELAAEATDADGIAQVAFLVDGAVVRRVSQPPFVAAFDTLSVNNASHVVAARAYDAVGGAADSAPVTVTVFNPGPRHLLTVTVDGPGAGKVTGPGLSCESGPAGPTTCSVLLDEGTSFALEAIPAEGSMLARWSGACTGAGACAGTLDGPKSVTARFEPASYPLTITLLGAGKGAVSGGGLSCASDSTAGCAGPVGNGATVTLIAAPDPSSSFKGWSGACAGVGECVLTVTGSRSVAARFEPQTYPLTVTVTGPGVGTVSGAGLSCTSGSSAGCSVDVEFGLTVTLTARPDGASVFKGWSGACTGTGDCTVTMSMVPYLAASFEPAFYRLSATLSGSGAGAITGGGLSCASGSTAGCAVTVPNGAVVALSATADAASIFNGWGVGCTGIAGCQVLMNSDKTVDARFDPSTYLLSAVLCGAGAGTVTGGGLSCTTGSAAGCSAALAMGSTVTLGAAPGAGSVFKGWTGGCSGTGTCTVTMNAAKSVYATFEPALYALTVSLSGAGQGTVSGGGISCASGSTSGCTALFAGGATVTLQATASAGSLFKGWSGGGCYGTGACKVAMTSAKTVVALFEPSTYPLVMTFSGTGRGTVTGGGLACTTGSTAGCSVDLPNGATVYLTATPDAASVFKGWGIVCTGTSTCRIRMNAPKTALARFDPAPVATTSP